MQTQRIVNMLGVGVILVGTTTACASKGFVRNQVDTVNQRAEAISQSLEQTQEQTRQNEAKIAEVNAKTDQVGIWAKDAQTSATSAQEAANAAAAKADAVEKRLVYEVVINEAQGNFKFGSSELPDAAKTQIDELVAKLKTEPQGSYIEIEGHPGAIRCKPDCEVSDTGARWEVVRIVFQRQRCAGDECGIGGRKRVRLTDHAGRRIRCGVERKRSG